jgi:undecaprenyl diphosphate synthase
MTSSTHDPRAYATAVGLDPARLPRHIAIIMDGNGRWAQARGKERAEGHAQGARSVDLITEECCRLGIGQLTLYCLSSENWKRPKPEIDFLMALLKQYLLAEREKIQRQNIRFTVIGRRAGLAGRGAGRDRRERAADGGQHRADAVPGDQLRQPGGDRGRGAVARPAGAVRGIVAGRIDERAISGALYTGGMPDPDCWCGPRARCG